MQIPGQGISGTIDRETCMADLKCVVENCTYNKDCLCSKGDIMVGGKHAMELQIELGCPAEKIKITPNGIDDQRFVRCLEEERKEDDTINIGAVLRIAPIKDVKTMIRAFAYAKKEAPHPPDRYDSAEQKARLSRISARSL